MTKTPSVLTRDVNTALTLVNFFICFLDTFAHYANFLTAHKPFDLRVIKHRPAVIFEGIPSLH